jgi:hypothetical protein
MCFRNRRPRTQPTTSYLTYLKATEIFIPFLDITKITAIISAKATITTTDQISLNRKTSASKQQMNHLDIAIKTH